MACRFFVRTTRNPLNPHVKKIRHLALDLDGTLYLGDTVFDWTRPFLQTLRALDIGYTFFTNNSSRSTQQYIEKLAAKGIEASIETMYSSTHATLDHLKQTCPQVHRLFILGTPGLREEFAQAGYAESDQDPQAVVVGFDTTLTYDRLCRCAYWVSQGLPYVATHPDLTCPTDEATVLPDCGAFCKCLEAATGRAPDAVLGKPNPSMLLKITEKHGLKPDELGMVGDRLYTDIVMAQKAGVTSVLVLSGEATLADAERSHPPPDLIVQDVGELGELLRKSHGASSL